MIEEQKTVYKQEKPWKYVPIFGINETGATRKVKKKRRKTF